MSAITNKPFARIGTVASVILLGVAAYLIYTYKQGDLTWEDIKESIQEAPAWLFLVTLAFLPPVGVPLSVFLFAVGARFGVVWGSLAAIIAIVIHHIVSLGISHFVSTDSDKEITSSSNLWQKLEKKTNGNSSKLLLLWGFLPGLPYVVKLYLPLAMGVNSMQFLKWNTLGHALGALLFVVFGKAVFDGALGTIVAVIAAIVVIGIGFRIFRNRLEKKSLAEQEAT